MAFELIKVSELPELTTPSDPNVIPIQDGDYLKRISFENLKEAVTDDVADDLAAEVTAREGAVSDEATARGNADTAILADLASPYSASATYAVGDYCTKDGQLYRCTTAISTAEAWTSGHWSAVALGDDTRDLRSAIGSFMMIDKSALVQGYYVAKNDGKRSPIASDYHYCTDFIYVKGLKRLVTRTVFNYSCIGFFGEGKNDELISQVTGTNDVLTTYDVEIPENAWYVAISFYGYYISTDNFYATFEETINDISLRINNLSDGLNDPLAGKTDYVSQAMTTFIRNDLDSNLVANSDIIEGSWINSAIGTFETNQYTSSYSRTDYVEVVAGQSYVWMDGNKPYSYSVFDELKTPISGYYGRTPNNPITIPQNGRYLSFCWDGKVGSSNYAVMIKGTTPISEYEPPFDKLINDPYATRKYVDSLIPESSEHPTLELPERYEVVVGDTFQMFWKGVINAVDYMNYYPEVVCDIGNSYTRFFQYTGAQADIGTHTMTVRLYDNGQNLLDEKMVNLVVKAKASSPASEKVVLYVTDSLGNNGYVPDEFNRRLVGTGGTPLGDGLTNITFIGTNSSTNRGIKYVGNGGWNWDSYNASMSTNKYMWVTANAHGKTSEDQHSIYTDTNNVEWQIETIETNRIKIVCISASGTLPATGTLTWKSGGANHSNIVYTASEQAVGNPFWSQTQNKISFSEFVTGQGESTLSFVYVLLGWNATGTTETALKTSVRTFLNNVLADYPSCKIVILGIEIPARDGLARNYGQNIGVLSSYRQSMNHVFNLNKWYAEVAEETAYVGKVSFVNVAGQFDTEYNMQASTITVNVRNPETLPFQNNGVHPAEPGYYQIADACYRDFVHKLQEE